MLRAGFCNLALILTNLEDATCDIQCGEGVRMAQLNENSFGMPLICPGTSLEHPRTSCIFKMAQDFIMDLNDIYAICYI